MMRKRIKRLMKTNLYLGKHRDDLKLSWSQVKRKYPRMKASGDSDFDGTLNSRDCKPLNPAMDARKARSKSLWERMRFKKGKAGSATRVMRKLAGERVKGQQKVKAGPGRPSGVFKHTSPLTGQKVPATTYYSHLKEARRRLRTQAQQSRIREQTAMARRGVPPQITRMRQMQRIQQPQYPQQIQQVQEYPQQIPTQYPPLQGQQPYKVVTDIMTGRRIIKSIPPRERWTM